MGIWLRNANSHSIRCAWLLRMRNSPNGRVRSAKDIRIIDILVAWGISSLGEPNGGFEGP